MTGIVVRHARVPDAARARPALEHWLAALEPRDWGLPPEAIVALRHARVPAAAVGREAPAQALGALLRGAARPARGDPVGAACPAVWFADEAELLACLAGDALDGALAQRWWWALLAAGHAQAGGPVAPWARWVAAPRAVPAALQRLGPARAHAWLAAGDGTARRVLLEALAEAWPVPPGLHERLARAEAGPIVAGPAAQGPRFVARVEAHAGPAASPRGDAGARDADGPDPDVFVDAATWLQALCSVLVEAPQRAGDLVVIAARAVSATGAHRAVPAASDGRSAMPVAPARTARSAATPPHASPRQESEPGRAADHDAPSDRITPVPAAAAAAARREGDPRAADTPRAAPPPRPRPTATKAHVALPTAATSALDTRFGGLFFLLNVATALGLYGDFTQPQHRGLPCSPWHWLQRAGRASLGRRFRADPLNAWLRAQAGPAPPLPRPSAWAAEAAQQAAFAEDPRPCHLLIDTAGQRLQHPAGFVLAWQAGPAALDAPPGTLVHRRRRRAAPPDLWTLTWPLVRARLGAALALPPHAALALTLALPARLRAGAGRVELQFALAGLPLALRFAGLDRDPGWLPAAGSDIRFRFD